MAKRQPLAWQLIGLLLVSACSSNATPPATGPGGTLHFVDGSHYTYANASYGVATPAKGVPSPIPTSASNDSIVVASPASFDGAGGLVKVEYQRKIATKRGIETLASNDYFGTRAAAGTTFLQHVGSNAPGFTLKYTSPAVVLEEPFRMGNHWDPSASYQMRSKDGDETWNGDGSYVSHYELSVRIGSAPPTIVRVHAVVKSDGSATMVSRGGDCTPVTLQVGVPVSQNGRYLIPYEESQANTCHGTPIVTKKLGVDWYPGGAQPPSPLESASVTDEGSAAIPAACNVPKSVATTGEKIVRNETILNPFGTITQSTDTRYYAQPRGLVCNLRSETLRVFSTLMGPGLLDTLETTDVRSMQTYSSGAGAALPSDERTGLNVGVAAATACLVPQLIGRNTKAVCSNTPALFRR